MNAWNKEGQTFTVNLNIDLLNLANSFVGVFDIITVSNTSLHICTALTAVLEQVYTLTRN